MSIIECHFDEVRRTAKQLDSFARQAKADLDAGKTELNLDTTDWTGLAKQTFDEEYNSKDVELKNKILRIEAMSIYLNELADKIEAADQQIASKKI